MKKNYLEPTEKVVDLGTEGRLLQDILSGETTEEGADLENPEDEDDAGVKLESIWDKIW